MNKRIDSKYNVVIIGAGIGGLVSGCYLAKAGVKVLLVEKHDKVGGYCTSFRKNGYLFDAAVHYIGAARHEGEINRIVEQLNLKDTVIFSRFDPCDKICLPEHTLFIRQRYHDTMEEFISKFPKSKKKIIDFFNLVMTKQFFYIYSKLKRASFKELLDEFFDDYKIKGTIATLLGNMGLPPSKISALTAVFLYREFILDPGYYPKGGIQAFPDALAQKFVKLGGDLVLLTKATKIFVKNNKVSGIEINNNKFINSDYVVSNVDASQTFFELVKESNKSMSQILSRMEPSISAFAVYLGLNSDLKKELKDKCAVWKFFTYDIEKCYGSPELNLQDAKLNYFVCTFPSLHDSTVLPQGKSTMGIFICAPFMDKIFWDVNKVRIADKLINAATEIVPSLNDEIEIKIIATPYTFYRYTLNKSGAIYGWASTPSQIDREICPQETYIEGLYLAGHWCTNGLGQGGVSEVAYTGRRAAKLIVKKMKQHSVRYSSVIT